jgi:hypothetical protein
VGLVYRLRSREMLIALPGRWVFGTSHVWNSRNLMGYEGRNKVAVVCRDPTFAISDVLFYLGF